MNLPDSDPLKPVCELLVRAFPQGVPEHLYIPLLGVLAEEMSFRAISRAIAVAFTKNYFDVLHDSFGAESEAAQLPDAVAEVRSKLSDAGYYALDD
ncbi:hypothetical protein [Hyalangium versicolor]|uniref:hypothetical protein n=1 Tax=Hyalangium versicolor TaxID=2861190 RepID=UPI001CCE6913|nr:hypothetical protein [Hyalangium versicolor]